MFTFEMDDSIIDVRYQEIALDALDKTLNYLDFSYEVDVCLTTTTNEVIQEINAEHRNIDRATDVLSFPMIDWPDTCDFNYLEKHMDYHINPETGNVLLGDIILSMDKVVSQAKEYGHSEEREYVFLIVHSLLHLFGYDHMEQDEEQQMIQTQKDILTTIRYDNQ